MPTAAHHRGRQLATLGAAGAHTYLGVIGLLDLLNYTVPTPYAVLEQIASEKYWAWIHIGCAVILVCSLGHPYHRPRIKKWRSDLPFASVACGIGFTMMFVWALFNLLWGLSTVRPVSLAGPGLAFIVAFGEQLLANAWVRGTHDKER